LDADVPITIVTGVHAGCFELFAGAGVRGIAELRGKRVGLASSPPSLLILMAATVGLDRKDIDWVTDPKLRPLDLFADGEIDAFLGFPPEPQELHARHAGRVIVSAALDRPWSEYFCCMLVGNREFVRKNPVATKHVVRAILKATDLCDSEPERVAGVIVDGGFADRSDPLLQILEDNPYKWREYDAGGHRPVLCIAVAGSGADQIDPAEDHCRGHRLALSRRNQTRAEGVRSIFNSSCPDLIRASPQCLQRQRMSGLPGQARQ
jgi:NitT/TauT family transport system substrate-binding protein